MTAYNQLKSYVLNSIKFIFTFSVICFSFDFLPKLHVSIQKTLVDYKHYTYPKQKCQKYIVVTNRKLLLENNT